jgi:POT family proton-dependent oligopeptide transporter
MLLALVIYIAGQRYLPDTRPLTKQRTTGVRLTREERRRAWALLAVIALTIPAEIAYPMVWSIGMVWVDQQVSLATQWGTIPAIWFGSVDSIGAILAAPVLIALWASQARKGREPGSVTKIAIGTGLIAVAALVIAASNLTAAGPGSVFVGWALAGYLLMGLAWMYYWPTTLALISRVAPRAVMSTLMGGAFLSPFIGHTVMGWIGSFYDRMTPAAFWTIDAVVALAGAVLLIAVRGPLGRALEAERGPD